ncbi:MAG: BamA/TamA family outer membrane protein [Gemmatimonadota bacterium]|nr:BamA/TamA family outer membrane protein [Gemmatimonadota bacterium]
MHAFTSSLRALVATSLLVAAPGIAHAQSSRPEPANAHDSIDVAALTFDGAHEVPAADLRTVIFTRTSACRLILFAPICKATPTLLFTDRRRTTRAALGEDITNLRVYYFRRGFRDAQVDTVLVPVKRGVDVTFRITEGPPTRIASLSVTQRDPVITPAELKHAVVLREGEPLNLVALDTTLTRLRDAAWNHGYGDVRIDTSVPRPDASRLVPVRIVVDPRYLTRVGEVEFEGNHVLSDATLRRALLLRPGGLYTRNAVLESERRLFESPALARALVVTPPEGDSVKHITVAVTETAPHHASATLGFNTVEFVQAAVDLRHNVLGAGRWLDARLRAGNLLGEQLNGRAIFRQAVPEGTADVSLFLRPTYQGSLTVTQPWIAGPRTSASLTVFGGRRSLPGIVVDEDLGATLGVVRELAVRLPVGLNYRIESTRVQGGGVYFCAGYGICDNVTIQALERRQRLAPIGASAWIDRSDDLEAPTSGYTAVLDAEHASSATGSTFAHNRVAADGSYYRAFAHSEDLNDEAFPKVLALHGRLGWVRPLDDRAALGVAGTGPGILHPRTRFYAGGMQSVRGFAENELGPEVLQARTASLIAAGCSNATIADGSCDPSAVPSNELFIRPTGGSSVVEGSVELRVSLMKQFGGVVFLDGAYVGASGIDSPASGKGAVTPGAGLRYRSVLGVLRLDLGLRPVGSQLLPVVAAVPDGAGGERIVRLSREKSYSPIDPSPGTLHSIARRIVVHFAMGQAF